MNHSLPPSARALASALVACCLAGTAHANLLTNGSFDQGTFTGGSFGFPLAQQLNPGDTTMPGWSVVSAEIAWFKSGQAGIATQDGQYALDLTGFCDLGLACGSPGVYGGVTQTVATLVGGTYHLGFYAGSYAFNGVQPTLTATVDGSTQNFLLDSTNQTAGAWTALGLDFVATSASTSITFGGVGGLRGSTFYLGLDNVSLDLTSAPTAVPEPGTYALMLAGLAGVGFVARLRRA